MITVNLLLPFARDVLQISCEEDMPAECLMEQIQTATMSFGGLQRKWLCHIDGRHQLAHDQTLMECGVTDGSNLIMI